MPDIAERWYQWLQTGQSIPRFFTRDSLLASHFQMFYNGHHKLCPPFLSTVWSCSNTLLTYFSSCKIVWGIRFVISFASDMYLKCWRVVCRCVWVPVPANMLFDYGSKVKQHIHCEEAEERQYIHYASHSDPVDLPLVQGWRTSRPIQNRWPPSLHTALSWYTVQVHSDSATVSRKAPWRLLTALQNFPKTV